MQYAADYGVSLMLLLSVGFLPSGFISYLIRERKQEEKQVQLTSGVSKMNYWMTTFIWDFMVKYFSVFDYSYKPFSIILFIQVKARTRKNSLLKVLSIC